MEYYGSYIVYGTYRGVELQLWWPEEVLGLLGGVQVLQLAEEIGLDVGLPLRRVGVGDLERPRRVRGARAGRHLHHHLGSGVGGDVVHVLLQFRRHHRCHPLPHHQHLHMCIMSL